VNIIETLNDVSDVIFPPKCLGCAEILGLQNGFYFCPDCREKIKFITGSLCPVCGTTFSNSPKGNHLCGDCLDSEPYFSCARAVVSYETIILHAIHQFKYGNNISVGDLLASFMADFSFPDVDFTDYSLIIPVPLHIQRLRQRGFNQSLILARSLAKKRQIPVNFSLLKRHKSTLTQTGLHKTERKQNIKGAFEVGDRKLIAGKNVILVDDVYTTGATINECTKTLLKAGAQKVTVLTLARVLPSYTH
jgi:ComF family protein